MEPKPNLHLNKDLEQNEKHELAAVPIFRGNDLYNSLFPEIEPAIKKGEEPDARKIFDSIIKQGRNKKIILDDTCFDFIMYTKNVSLESLPEELEFSEVPVSPYSKNFTDLEEISKKLKEKFNITYDADGNTIDSKIKMLIGDNFSPKIAKEFIDLAKEKNPNIKKVFIIEDKIADHAGGTSKEEILKAFVEEVKNSLQLEPQIVSTISSEQVTSEDLIIVDRHNQAVSTLSLDKKFPKQVSILPLESEFHNLERLGIKTKVGDIKELLRKAFEE